MLIRQMGLIGFFKSLFYSAKYFGIKKAFKFPFMVGKNTKIKIDGILKTVSCNFDCFPVISVGIASVPYASTKTMTILFVQKGGIMEIDKKVVIGKGCSVRVYSESLLRIGNNFYMNNDSQIACTRKITFGANVLVGYDCEFRDSDGHKYKFKDKESIASQEINIGEKIWIGAKAAILKGACIGNNSIIGYGSMVNKDFSSESGVIIAGRPAKVIKRECSVIVDW